jgi:hypothetical protein
MSVILEKKSWFLIRVARMAVALLPNDDERRCALRPLLN